MHYGFNPVPLLVVRKIIVEMWDFTWSLYANLVTAKQRPEQTVNHPPGQIYVWNENFLLISNLCKQSYLGVFY
jgi:hypothetical protein